MSAPPWQAEHPVDAALCRRLVAERFPACAVGEPVRLGAGWCNDVWRLGPATWRFPRKAAAVPPLEREVRFLPGLAPRLPVRIPVPEWVGAPAPGYPAPFYGHRFLAGTPVDARGLDDAGRAALAAPLGRFLRALHDIPEEVAAELGVPDGAWRCDLGRRVGLARGYLEGLAPLLGDAGVAAVAAGLERADAAPGAACRALLHGDLYARHLLLDERGALAAVIDWEDACLGDPGADLSVVATLLPAAARPAFWAAYGPVDAVTGARAEGFGWTYVAFLGAYALAQGDEALGAEVRAAARFLGTPLSR